MGERITPKVVLGLLTLLLIASVSMATGVWAPGGRGGATASQIDKNPVKAASYIPWEYSLEGALQRAAGTRQPILVDFYTDWCPSCKSMDAAYATPEVTAIAGNLIAVKVNAETRTDLAAKYGVVAYPTTVVLNSDGSVYTSFCGAYSPSDLEQWLRSTFPAAVPTGA
jgi:thiol:disulfide interchange protein